MASAPLTPLHFSLSRPPFLAPLCSPATSRLVAQSALTPSSPSATTSHQARPGGFVRAAATAIPRLVSLRERSENLVSSGCRRSGIAEVAPGVDRGVVDADFVMQVRPG